jgi:hypothetical protein
MICPDCKFEGDKLEIMQLEGKFPPRRLRRKGTALLDASGHLDIIYDEPVVDDIEEFACPKCGLILAEDDKEAEAILTDRVRF